MALFEIDIRKHSIKKLKKDIARHEKEDDHGRDIFIKNNAINLAKNRVDLLEKEIKEITEKNQYALRYFTDEEE